MNSRRIKPVEIGELTNFDLQGIERVPLVFARMNEHGHGMAEGHISESVRRILDEPATGECQRANEAIARLKGRPKKK